MSKALSFAPEDLAGGAIFEEGFARIEKPCFIVHQFENKDGDKVGEPSTFALFPFRLTDGDGTVLDDGAEPILQYLGIGGGERSESGPTSNFDDFQPSADGVKSLCKGMDGEEAMGKKGPFIVNGPDSTKKPGKNSKYGLMIQSLVEHGLKPELLKSGDIRVLDGLVAHFVTQERKAVGAGKPYNVLIADRIVKMPKKKRGDEDEADEVAPKKAAKKKVADDEEADEAPVKKSGSGSAKGAEAALAKIIAAALDNYRSDEIDKISMAMFTRELTAATLKLKANKDEVVELIEDRDQLESALEGTGASISGKSLIVGEAEEE